MSSKKFSISFEVTPQSLKQIKQLEKKLPRAAMRGIDDGTEQIAQSLRSASNSAFRIQTGALNRSIVVQSPYEGVFEIKMAEYGRYLNDAPDYAHWISLKPGRKITEWARNAGMGTWVKHLYVMGGQTSYAGWIDTALNQAPTTINSNIIEQLGEL